MSNKKYTIALTPNELESVIQALAYFETELENDYDDTEIPENHPFMRAFRKVQAARHG